MEQDAIYVSRVTGGFLQENTDIVLAPRLGPEGRKQLCKYCRALQEATGVPDQAPTERQRAIRSFRNEINVLGDCPSTEKLKLLAVLHVVGDLVGQGWGIKAAGDGLTLVPSPEANTGRSKDFVRQSHLAEREAQLQQPSVAEFLRGMERRRLTTKGWHSIHSLMRDGQDLRERFGAIAVLPDERERQERLLTVITPYLEFVTPGAVCQHTGLLLGDIWRYFRHTWVNAYHSVPGRSMMILIRDAANPFHPVIGIAALGSSVVQQTVRDRWIGWDATTVAEHVLAAPSDRTVRWLDRQLRSFIDGVYLKDLREARVLAPGEITKPTEKTIERLRKRAARAMKNHRANPQKSLHKNAMADASFSVADWARRAESHLFVAKRCRLLASLLSIKKVLCEELGQARRHKQIAAAFNHTHVRTAVSQLVRFVKAERVGINMMDITVCGALAPYNEILGGKLVCLLLCSPEVVLQYAKRYGRKASVIASCTKGKPVIRRPELVLLGTTSLYGIGSSQYNRIKVPAEQVGGRQGERIEYQELGRSLGYGSFHLSNETVEVMNILLGRTNEGRRVNSIFGEGVNPLMRKIRDALDLLGIQSDAVLRHGNKRIVYGIRLASNFREFLFGLQQRPRFILPQKHPAETTQRLAAYWQRRWLDSRIRRAEILERVATHTTTFPIKHGALVVPPEEDTDPTPLFKMARDAH